MSYVLQLKGKLAELRRKRGELAIRADASVKAIKNLLATATVDDLAEVDADAVAILAGELRETKAKYLNVLDDMRKVEKELDIANG